jgi:3-hydroxyisobutyrate dehydrogenase
MQPLKVAFLGLGEMGSRMAASLARAGFALTVWSRNSNRADPLRALGAATASQPNEAAADADIVVAMLRDDGASRAVWTNAASGALQAMRPGAVAIDSSTLTPAWIRELSALASARSISLLDAPVSGSRLAAESKTLIYLVGGEAKALERAQPVQSAIGKTIHHVGPSGSGAVVKLMINALLGIQTAALAELIGIATRAGLDAAKALAVIHSTPVSSPALVSASQAMQANEFAPIFPIELFEKDMGYAADTAAMLGAGAPLVLAAREVLKAAMQAGWGKEQYTAVAKLYR